MKLTSVAAAAILAWFADVAVAQNTTTIRASSFAGAATSDVFPPASSESTICTSLSRTCS